MDKVGLVSVIIPTYNRAKQIANSVESVQNQTYKNIEIIIIDDGSIDDTEVVVDSFCKRDSRIQYYKLDCNGGASIARNVGIDKANGEYIAFHDSDDLMVRDRIEVQLKYLLESDADMVFAQVERHDAKNNTCMFYPVDYSEENLSINKTYLRFLYEGVVWTQTILGSAESIKNIKFDVNMKNRVDMDWAIRYSKIYKVCFQKIPVAISYISSDSISQNSNNTYKSTEMMYQKYYEDISKYKYINNKWLFDISIKKWDLRIANSQDLWLMFKLTKRPAWLIKMIMIIVFKDKTYNIIGKINKNET